MIILLRRVTAVCALSAVLAACGTDRPPRAAPPPVAAPPSRPPTLAPGPAGLTPVFEHGPRTRGRTVALTFDAT
ncbi:polysaccharide deacetylase family sporulation protein PdaB [Streptomyces azureus]|uniref:Polysaccharide deacetylase family sporulation protein PdaB n=1 Tax=Streptomyces azureus TaxID=146537 RepID=A0A0K8PMK5_STRAJ|nr:polysaccharide deacetylase family sporulation protein PdaB [Streptomyces azureus]